MLNYAQLSLRRVTKELDTCYARQEALAEIAKKEYMVHLVMSAGPHSFTLLLTEAQAEELISLTDSILFQQKASLVSQELSWCREIMLLDEQDKIGKEAMEQHRLAKIGDGN